MLNSERFLIIFIDSWLKEVQVFDRLMRGLLSDDESLAKGLN